MQHLPIFLPQWICEVIYSCRVFTLTNILHGRGGVLPISVSVHHLHGVPVEVRGGQRSSLETRVTNGFYLPSGCWEMNPGPLQEQLVHLTSFLFLLLEPNTQQKLCKHLLAFLGFRRWNT